MKRTVWVAVFYCITLVASLSSAAQPQSATKSVPTSYVVVPDFPELTPSVKLGATSAVAIDSKGRLLVFHRGDLPILVLTPEGKLIRSFGDGLFKSAHGLRIDKQDNVWVTDNANHTVLKFSPDGVPVMKLGEKDVPGDDAFHFNKPTDVAFAENGDFFVSDGYGNSRVVKFNSKGEHLKTWGRKGTGDGEFNLPHAIQVDARGEVYVADRENDRVQVFTAGGEYLRQFGGMAPFGMFIAPDQTMFIADGRANKVLHMTLDGKVLSSWGSSGTEAGQFQMPHGITVASDKTGASDKAVYVTEINGKRIQKFLPR